MIEVRFITLLTPPPILHARLLAIRGGAFYLRFPRFFRAFAVRAFAAAFDNSLWADSRPTASDFGERKVQTCLIALVSPTMR
jgi:hypothetical protein